MPHSILFTGHMIDKPGRSEPRFPPEKESAASAAVRNTLRKVQATAGAEGLRGIAAAACGGDILFHEACRELKIPSEIYLGIPIDAFEQTSVAFAGPGWITRYRTLTQELSVHVLLPNTTADAPDTVWAEANEWMLHTALADGSHLTLIALWDGQKGDGPGGTDHLVNEAKAHQAAVELIDILRL